MTSYTVSVCNACGNIYLVSGTRYYCPLCSGSPLSLADILEPPAPPTEEAASPATSPEETLLEEPAPDSTPAPEEKPKPRKRQG